MLHSISASIFLRACLLIGNGGGHCFFKLSPAILFIFIQMNGIHFSSGSDGDGGSGWALQARSRNSYELLLLSTQVSLQPQSVLQRPVIFICAHWMTDLSGKSARLRGVSERLAEA